MSVLKGRDNGRATRHQKVVSCQHSHERAVRTLWQIRQAMPRKVRADASEVA